MLTFQGRRLVRELALQRAEEYSLDPYQPRLFGRFWSYATELGIPLVLFTLAAIFNKQTSIPPAAMYLRRFISAIPVGADLSLVWPQFVIWLLTDPIGGMLKYATNESEGLALISASDFYLKYYQALAEGETNPAWQEWYTVAAYWQEATARNQPGIAQIIYGTAHRATVILIAEATLRTIEDPHVSGRLLVPATAEQVIAPVCDLVHYAASLAVLVDASTRSATTFLGATANAACIRLSEKLLGLLNNDSAAYNAASSRANANQAQSVPGRLMLEAKNRKT
jgi:hypothetical protein